MYFSNGKASTLIHSIKVSQYVMIKSANFKGLNHTGVNRKKSFELSRCNLNQVFTEDMPDNKSQKEEHAFLPQP